MTPLRFRAWDKRFKRMVYGDPMVIFYLDDSDHEIMQSTGLKDKNGLECFQGDLVRSNDKTYELRWMEDTCCNEFVGIDNSERWIIHTIPAPIEIVGNIYHHSQLLNGKA